MEFADLTFQQRHRAATIAVHAGDIEGDLALSYIIWPRFEDIPRDLTSFRKVIAEAAPLCPAMHGRTRCGAPADVSTGLCEDHFWAFMSGEQFDFWGDKAA